MLFFSLFFVLVELLVAVLFHFLCQLLIITTVNVVVTEYLRAHSLVCLSPDPCNELKVSRIYTLRTSNRARHTHARTHTAVATAVTLRNEDRQGGSSAAADGVAL